MVRKSLKFNSFILMLNKLLDALFPIVTFSLTVRALGVENIGVFGYANSITHYFVLFAGLGVETYAIREGAKIREDSNKIKRFIGEIFGLNVITSLLTYVILCIYLLIFLQNGKLESLIWISSLQIIVTTLGVEWVITIYEDFSFILLRNLMFKALTLLLVFLFVRTEDDLIIYAIIVIISSVIMNLVNFVYAKRRTDFSIVISKDLVKYLLPLLQMFLIQILIDIYSSVDVTMLGALKGDVETGYYTAALKVYSVLCAVMSSAAIAAYPKVSAIDVENDQDAYNRFCNNLFDLIFTFSLPAMIGVILLKDEIIGILCGDEFLPASTALGILAVAFVFNIANWFWTRAYVLPLKKDKRLVIASFFTSLENVTLNLLIIPFLGHIGAAITTVLAEMTLTIFCIFACWNHVKKLKIKNFLKTILGSIAVTVVVLVIKLFIKEDLVKVAISIPIAVAVYSLIELVLKHEFVMELVDGLKKK